MTIMDEELMFGDNPNDCFIYWLVCRKVKAANKELLLDLNQFYYDEINERPKYFCSNTGELLELEGEAYIRAYEPGAVLFGPYRDYQKGEYKASFTFMPDGEMSYLSSEIICRCDVVAGSECKELGCVYITGNSFGENLFSVEIPFACEKNENLQFRVIAECKKVFYVKPEVEVKQV